MTTLLQIRYDMALLKKETEGVSLVSSLRIICPKVSTLFKTKSTPWGDWNLSESTMISQIKKLSPTSVGTSEIYTNITRFVEGMKRWSEDMRILSHRYFITSIYKLVLSNSSAIQGYDLLISGNSDLRHEIFEKCNWWFAWE